MMISTKGRYALRVMLDIALQPQGEHISLKAISQRQEVSMKYLEAIVSNMGKAGLVDSFRGKNGGYRLNRLPSEYTVGEILRAAEGEIVSVGCLGEGKKGCDRADTCLTLPFWKKLDEVVDSYLESVTLQDILENKLNVE